MRRATLLLPFLKVLNTQLICRKAPIIELNVERLGRETRSIKEDLRVFRL